jgi:hypothetical protein
MINEAIFTLYEGVGDVTDRRGVVGGQPSDKPLSWRTSWGWMSFWPS